MFSNVWSEKNTALFERLMEIHSNSPKLYYGFKGLNSVIQPVEKDQLGCEHFNFLVISRKPEHLRVNNLLGTFKLQFLKLSQKCDQI